MITPSFSLDFTAASLDPRITFTRALATATRVDASGFIETVAADTPRFDYDPVTLACRGLLLEEARTNTLRYSSDYTQSVWTKTGWTTTTSAGAAPDGTSTAQLATETTAANSRHYATQSVSLTTGTTYTASFYAKSNGKTFVQIGFYGATSTGNADKVAAFNLSTLARNAASGVTTTITSVGNGWYRCSATYTTVGSGTTIIGFGSANNLYAFWDIYTGNGTSGVFIWGAQLEVGDRATSYIPTTTTAVTRNADVATITGTNFSDWWQASKGGVLVRARPGTVSGVRPWVQFDDGTANEIIALRGNTTNPELYIVDGGVAQAQIDAGAIAANTDYSLTGWWATNDCKARLDSGAVVTDTSATIPTVTQARLGSDGTNYLNGHLASISYYDSFSEQIYTRRKNKAVFNLM